MDPSHQSGHQHQRARIAVGRLRARLTKRTLTGTLLLFAILFALILNRWTTSSCADRTITLPHFGSSLAVSPDGRIVAVGDFNGCVSFVSSPKRSPFVVFQTHDQGMRSITFSPDGRKLASIGYDGLLRVWDVASAKQVMENSGDQMESFCLAFSPDGRYLASAGQAFEKGGQITIWDCSSWEVIRRIEGLSTSVRAIVFSPDAMRIITKMRDGPVQEWDLRLNAPLNTKHVDGSGFNVLQYSPDGKLLFLGDTTYHGNSLQKIVVALNASTGKTMFTIPTIGEVALSSDSQLLAVASGRKRGSVRATVTGLGRLDIYSIPGGKLIASYRESGYIESPQFIPNTHTVVATGGLPEGPGRLYFYDVKIAH